MTYSFVLIAYNEAENIMACIQSIESLAQLGDDFEIIVVDDGSRDDTRDLVSAYGIAHPAVKLIGDGSNHGRGYGRFSGVNQTKGDYIVMVDADIILPPDWLEKVVPSLTYHDVAGGIAVPDGDVAYLYRRFSLKPRTVMGSTTITGNNGIYKRAIFSQVNFDPSLRDGEDFDFNKRAEAAGFKLVCVPGLTVDHAENKSFPTSMKWLFQSGIGATRILIRFHKLRMPDLAFFAILISLMGASILSGSLGWWYLFAVPLLGIAGTALLHLRSKFEISNPLRFAGAWLANCILIACYYVGRLVGFTVYQPTRKQSPAAT